MSCFLSVVQRVGDALLVIGARVVGGMSFGLQLLDGLPEFALPLLAHTFRRGGDLIVAHA